MILDLHIHTTMSGDSTIEHENLVQLARNADLDGICITEHGREKSRIANMIDGKHDFPVFGGMEASTDLGDFLIFGVNQCPRNISKAKELKAFVEQEGGVMIAAHPFRSRFLRSARYPKPSVDEACRYEFTQLVDAMEVFNGWSTGEEVLFASKVSKKLKLSGTGGSDAHVPWQVGCCVTIFDRNIRNEAELVTELKRGAFRCEDRRTPEVKKDPTHWFSDCWTENK
ncbi:MAG: PHP domain-containing protein [Chloroflexota bacterium]|nr:PHP domain-containing protein [Chloroflexota bacterium]